MQVRLLTGEDGGRYWALRQVSTETPSFGIEPRVQREVEARPDETARVLVGYAAEDTRVWGVFDRDALVAVGALTCERPASCCSMGVLWGVFVLPRYRGTPASRLLMDAIVEDCRVDGDVLMLFTRCAHRNVAGRRFLQRFGFEMVVDGMHRGLDGVRESDELHLLRLK